MASKPISKGPQKNISGAHRIEFLQAFLIAQDRVQLETTNSASRTKHDSAGIESELRRIFLQKVFGDHHPHEASNSTSDLV